MPTRRPPKRVAPEYPGDDLRKKDTTAIKVAARRLGVPSTADERFISDVLEALFWNQIFIEQLDRSATPAEMLAGLDRIKNQAERLRRRAGFHSIRLTLQAIISACNTWTKQLAGQVRRGRRPSQALKHTFIMLFLALIKHAPTASIEDIKQAVCICLDAADISYPDPQSHPDRFDKLLGISPK